MGRFGFIGGVVTGLTIAAIGQELAKEPEERTWKGKVAGIPYNFRFNEWPNIATEYWNPENDSLIVPHVIGLGWGINFAAVAQRVRAMMPAQPDEEPRRVPEPVER